MEETSTSQIQNLNIRLHLVLPSFLLNGLLLHLTVPNHDLDIGVLHPRLLTDHFSQPRQKLLRKDVSRIASRQISPSYLCYLSDNNPPRARIKQRKCLYREVSSSTREFYCQSLPQKISRSILLDIFRILSSS